MARKQRYDYFDAYEQLMALAVKESECLIDSIGHFDAAASLVDSIETVHSYEHKGDLINHEIFKNAATDFMPPIDREDVVELARALDDVLDYIEDVLQHMYMYDIHMLPADATVFADLIKKSCVALKATMADFRNFKKSKQFKQLIVDINNYEEEADELYKNAIRHLHTVENDDVMHVRVWSRIYERMERCCDACERVADIISTIVLKNR